MKIQEIMESMGATTSGAIATVSQPMGAVQTRGGSLLGGKYTTDSTPNTPEWMKKLKGKRRAK
jgi:hypothetical protein